jgi:hypothetical protein
MNQFLDFGGTNKAADKLLTETDINNAIKGKVKTGQSTKLWSLSSGPNEYERNLNLLVDA